MDDRSRPRGSGGSGTVRIHARPPNRTPGRGEPEKEWLRQGFSLPLVVIVSLCLAIGTVSAGMPGGVPSWSMGDGSGFWPSWCTVDERASIVSINLSRAGTAARVAGPQLIIAGPEADLVLVTGGIAITQGNAAGVVTGVSLQSRPLRYDGTEGLLTGSFRAVFAGLPFDEARVAVSIAEQPALPDDTLLREAAAAQGVALAASYGVLTVRTNGMPDVGDASVWLSAPRSWVAAHGGIGAIRIVRAGPDGTAEVLETRFVGYGEEGSMVFEASSPNGLATFVLAAVESAVVPSDPGDVVEPAIVAAALPDDQASGPTLASPLTVTTIEPVGAASRPPDAGGSLRPATPFVVALALAGCVVIASAIILGISRGSIRRVERR